MLGPQSLSKSANLLHPPEPVNKPNFDIPQANPNDDSYPESNDELEEARYDHAGVKVVEEDATENQEDIEAVEDSEEIEIHADGAHIEKNTEENDPPLKDSEEQELVNINLPPSNVQVDDDEERTTSQPQKESPKHVETPQRTVKVPGVISDADEANNQVDNGAVTMNETGQVIAAIPTEHAQNKTVSNSTEVTDEVEEVRV